ncbi:MAG: nickel pincer cofactor biosynthesis protein LarC [Oscillospiraceae bacterium]|nr:nickel pincer cofactor biosynthesis protein LarC [Oscillospiraceae bacterium]
MKTLYIECNMGVAGDMLMSALLELHPSPEEFLEKLNGLDIPGVAFKKSVSVKCGITGTHIDVSVNGEVEGEHCHEHHHEHHHEHKHHHHSGMNDIEHIISRINVSEKVRADALAVYRLIAEAESHAHRREISEIHFHEVGTMDAVADVVGTCLLLEELAPEKIIVSPVNVGSGQVKCAHGILPVPAPATAYILRGVPIYGGEIRGELCTPTGAALLKYFADRFDSMPVMRVSAVGIGMGSKDFAAANCVRAFYGETRENNETVAELYCNIDDMTGEEIGFAVNRLLAAGALDVFTTPIAMKKNRPGILLTCMCRAEDREKMLKLIFKHTSTIGVREHISNRYTLERAEETVNTEYGDIRVKKSRGYGVSKSKAEYDDVEKAALENDLSLTDIKRKMKIDNYSQK